MQMVQGTLDDLGTALASVTFVVVDLETTGASPNECAITEIGAVKVRGGEVLGEFQTLVNPRTPIPALISVLTGITDAMVAQAPRLGVALPAFLDFARGSVLVAHNARFDMAFLKAGCAQLDLAWPTFTVLDTVHLARQLVPRGEVRDHRLATLARHFRAGTTPNHRALEDARATVDVLHGLVARVGNLGVHSLEELQAYSRSVPAATRRKRHLADSLPDAPGVYLFKDARGRVLYVGTSGSLRTRVRSYFTAGETRKRMAEMVRLAESVTPIVCATALEAEVRELRLIAEHKPPYNRRSRDPEKVVWVTLTDEHYPRLSVVREVGRPDATVVGPFRSRSAAADAVAAVHEATRLRQCLERLPRAPRRTACSLAELDRCGAPCTGAQSLESYAAVVEQARGLLAGDGRAGVEQVRARLVELAGQERFEEAATVRDRLLTLLRGAERAQRLTTLARLSELVAARRAATGGWEVVAVRHGRLAGSTITTRGQDPMPQIEALRASAEVVPAPTSGALAALPEESERILAWLDGTDVRLVVVEGTWTSPVGGAGMARAQLEPLTASRRRTAGLVSPAAQGRAARLRA